MEGGAQAFRDPQHSPLDMLEGIVRYINPRQCIHSSIYFFPRTSHSYKFYNGGGMTEPLAGYGPKMI
jgi:hypothetical protein